MKILSPAVCLAALVALSGCAGPSATEAPAASASNADTLPAAADTPSTSVEAAPAAVDSSMPAMTPAEHAAMDAANTAHAANHDVATAGMDMHGKDMKGMDRKGQDMKGMDMKGQDMKGMDMKGMAGEKVGWYRSGTLQACGSTASTKLNNTAEIEKQIKAGGMRSGDPVYVRLEGKMDGSAFNVTRVAQVGSPTPVRDCAMNGVVTQSP